jgi:hypothetical protein
VTFSNIKTRRGNGNPPRLLPDGRQILPWDYFPLARHLLPGNGGKGNGGKRQSELTNGPWLIARGLLIRCAY